MNTEIIARRAKIEREWFKKEYEKQFSKPSREEKDENAELEKVVQKFRKLSKRKVCERKQFYPTVTLPASSEPVEWYRTPLAIKCVCPANNCSCCCKGNTLLPSKRLPIVLRYNWWGLKEFLWKLRIMKYDKPAGTFTPRLVETAKRESLFYRSAEGQAILIERGPEFCLSGCLKFFITNRKLEKNFAAAIKEIKEQMKEEVVEPEEVKTEEKPQKKRPLSDRICFQYRCTVSSQANTTTDGEFVIGDYSHLLFGSPDENILCDIDGVELQVSTYKDDPTDPCAFLSVTKTAKKLFHVEQIKDRISKAKKDFITSVFEIPERFNSKESQYECTDIPEELQRKEGICESLAEVRRRRKEKECFKKSLERSLHTDMLMSGFISYANEPYSSFEIKATNSGDDNISTSRESKPSTLSKFQPRPSYIGKELTNECTPASSEPKKSSIGSVTITESNQQELENLHSSLKAPSVENPYEKQNNIQLQDTISINKEHVSKEVANITGAAQSTINSTTEGEPSKKAFQESLRKIEDYYTPEKQYKSEIEKYQVLSKSEKMSASPDKAIKNSTTLEPIVLLKEIQSVQGKNLNPPLKDEDKLKTTTINLKVPAVEHRSEKQENVQLEDAISTIKEQVNKEFTNITGAAQSVVDNPTEGELLKEGYQESLKKNEEHNTPEKENIIESEKYHVFSKSETNDASLDKVIKNATTLEPPVLLKEIQPVEGKYLNPPLKDEEKLTTTITSLKAPTVEYPSEKQEDIQLQDTVSTNKERVDKEVPNITGAAQSFINSPIEGDLSKEVFQEALKKNKEHYTSNKENITESEKYQVLSKSETNDGSLDKVIKNVITLEPPFLLKEIQPVQENHLNPTLNDEEKLTTTSTSLKAPSVEHPSEKQKNIHLQDTVSTNKEQVDKEVLTGAAQSTINRPTGGKLSKEVFHESLNKNEESKSLDEKLKKSTSENPISQNKKYSNLSTTSKLREKDEKAISDSNNLQNSAQKLELQFNENYKLGTVSKETDNILLSTEAKENNKQATVTEQRSSSTFAKKIRTKLSKFSWKSLLSSHSVKRIDKSPLSINVSFKRSCNTIVLDKPNDSKLSHDNLTDTEGSQIVKDTYLNRLENDEAEKGDSDTSGPKSQVVIGATSDETNTVESTTTDTLETDVNKYYRFYY